MPTSKDKTTMVWYIETEAAFGNDKWKTYGWFSIDEYESCKVLAEVEHQMRLNSMPDEIQNSYLYTGWNFQEIMITFYRN